MHTYTHTETHTGCFVFPDKALLQEDEELGLSSATMGALCHQKRHYVFRMSRLQCKTVVSEEQIT